MFPEIVISPTKSLTEEFERVIKLFQENEIDIYIPNQLNNTVLAKDFIKIFNVYEGKGTSLYDDKNKENKKHTIIVVNCFIDDEKINQILNSFSQTSNNHLVHFYSAYPLPGILSFLAKNESASFFEFAAIRNLKNIEQNIIDIDLDKYHNVFLDLAKKYFFVEFNDKPADILKNIEQIIINNFRGGMEYDKLIELESDHYPFHSMLFVSLYLAFVIRKNLGGSLVVTDKNDINTIGIGISLNNNKEIDVIAHTLDKAYNFFYNGKDSSIINWYYEIKYLLNQSIKTDD